MVAAGVQTINVPCGLKLLLPSVCNMHKSFIQMFKTIRTLSSNVYFSIFDSNLKKDNNLNLAST